MPNSEANANVLKLGTVIRGSRRQVDCLLRQNKVMGMRRTTEEQGDRESSVLHSHYKGISHLNEEGDRPTDRRKEANEQQCGAPEPQRATPSSQRGRGGHAEDQKSIRYSVRMPNCGIPTSMGVSSAEEQERRGKTRGAAEFVT